MLPELERAKTYKSVQESFERGLWHRSGQKQNTYFAGENLCGAGHPALAPRPPRRIWQLLSEGAQGMHCAGGLYLVSQGELILAKDYMQHEELGRLGASTAKTFGTLGSQVLILPDFSLLDTGAQTLTPKSVSLLLAQVKVKNQDYVDEDGVARTIKFNTLHCVDFPFTDYFKAGDSIRLSGTQHNDGTYTIRAVEEFHLRFDENSFVAEDIESCTVTNRPPQMTQLCECGGRLWGFAGSHIYACALGEPANWYRYDGDRTSSYAAHVPGKGDFTACVSHGGHPVFFRSDGMVEILGDAPENFAAVEVNLCGVKQDSARSLCSVGGNLIYLSDQGVVRCSGSGTEVLSEALGTNLGAGFAVSDGRRYWLSAVDESGTRRLYVYDSHCRVWHVQDGADICALDYMDGQVYALEQNGTVLMLGEHPMQKGMAQSPVASCVEFYPLEDALRGKITPLRLGVRVWCGAGSKLSLSVSYDGGEWQKRAELSAVGERLWYVPLSPQACFSLGVRLEGTGEYSVKSIVKEYR